MPDVIEIQELHKNYGQVEAVKGISFSVNEDSFFALLGENGAGKSTTISILATLVRKTSGDVIVNHHHVDRDDSRIRRDIGIVFQGSMLDKYLTVKENIINRSALYGLSRQETEVRIHALAPKIGASEILGAIYGKLSGGQKRRADILRALINRPKILILDEPTTGLDPNTRRNVWETITDLKKQYKLTIFLTTHYMEEAAGADKVVIMDKGEIKASGTPEQLRIAHSRDKLILVARNTDIPALWLKDKGLSFDVERDRITVLLESSFDAIAIINQIKEQIDGFEVVRGNMDDVFIRVTGHGKGA